MHSYLEPLLVSSEESRIQAAFSGYAFSGAHLVIGEKGYEEWLAVGRDELIPHQDGCYMVVRNIDEGIEIGADYKGYCKLYIYRNGKDWAVSNSFAQLVERARTLGWPITPNQSVLSTWSFPGAFWQQFSTFETAAREIEVLPRQHVLNIGSDGGLRVVAPEREAPQPDAEAYRLALGRFIQTWISRVGTAIRETDTQIVSELTGGMDSRVTLSIMIALRQFFPTDFSRQLSLMSGLGYPEDLRIATQIAKTYRLRINRKLHALPHGSTFHDPFQRWWDFNLGSYGPIYWPAASSMEGRFMVGGHGGEGHRAYWRYESPAAVLEAHKDSFPTTALYEEARASFAETAAILSAEYPGVTPTVAHYREFRDRLHSGLHAQQQIRMQPLASGLMYEASSLLSSEELERGQMLYDVVAQTAPALLAMPYDAPHKVPSAEILGGLVAPVALNPMRGEIFGSGTGSLSAEPLQREAPWEATRDRFETAAARLPDGLVSEETIVAGRAALDEIRTAGKLKHPRFSRPIHEVLLADLVSR